jgi:hypothetical protein
VQSTPGHRPALHFVLSISLKKKERDEEDRKSLSLPLSGGRQDDAAMHASSVMSFYSSIARRHAVRSDRLLCWLALKAQSFVAGRVLVGPGQLAFRFWDPGSSSIGKIQPRFAAGKALALSAAQQSASTPHWIVDSLFQNRTRHAFLFSDELWSQLKKA